MSEKLARDRCSGTLVGNDAYEQSRGASIDDVAGILELTKPLDTEGVLIKRSRELLETEISHFRVLKAGRFREIRCNNVISLFSGGLQATYHAELEIGHSLVNLRWEK